MKGEVIYISKILLSSTFEFDLNNVKIVDLRDSHVGKPVKGIHFIAIARAAGAIVLTASGTTRSGRAGTTSSHNL
jgi:hypothetical protein